MSGTKLGRMPMRAVPLEASENVDFLERALQSRFQERGMRQQRKAQAPLNMRLLPVRRVSIMNIKRDSNSCDPRKQVKPMSAPAVTAVCFATANREFQIAWDNPAHTQFELPPVNVNKVLRDRYRVEPATFLTRAMIWDMEVKKAWDPRTYIPYVVSEGRSWGRHSLQDRSERFYRSSMQRGWITPEQGRILEDVYVSHDEQRIFFQGRATMTAEDGEQLRASDFQPLFHVEHGVGGSDDEPLNLWRIVLLTPRRDMRYTEPFEQMVRAGLLPGFIEIYIEKDLQMRLIRI
jgi:hypothetical protein